MKKNRLMLFRPKKWSIWMVIKDIKNYISWIKTVKKEKSNKNSKWYNFNMSHNYFYTIYFPLTLPEQDLALLDNIKRLRVVESLAPVHRYIDEDLQFAEYIVPEFNQFYDENNEPTLTYGIVYRFAFKRLSLGWIINRILINFGIVWVSIKYPILSIALEKIKWLINLI